MSVRRSFEHRLNDWLDEGPQIAPPDLLEVILEEFPGQRQRRLFGRGRISMSSFARLGFGAAAVVVVMIAVVIAAQLPTDRSGITPTPTPGWADRFPTKTAWAFIRPFEFAIDPASGLEEVDRDPQIYSFRVPIPGQENGFRDGIVVRSTASGLRREPCQQSGGAVDVPTDTQDWVDYITSVEGLQVSEPMRTVVDGRDAVTLDITYAADAPCADLFVFEGVDYPLGGVDHGQRPLRFTAVAVEGVVVLIAPIPTETAFEDWLPTAQAFMDTIHFLPGTSR